MNLIILTHKSTTSATLLAPRTDSTVSSTSATFLTLILFLVLMKTFLNLLFFVI